jgi:hypothetical protein
MVMPIKMIKRLTLERREEKGDGSKPEGKYNKLEVSILLVKVQ